MLCKALQAESGTCAAVALYCALAHSCVPLCLHRKAAALHLHRDDLSLCISTDHRPLELFKQVKRWQQLLGALLTTSPKPIVLFLHIPTMLWMMDSSTRREAYLAVTEVNDEGKPTLGLRFFSFNIPCRLEDSKHHKVLELACKGVEPPGGSSAIAPEQRSSKSSCIQSRLTGVFGLGATWPTPEPLLGCRAMISSTNTSFNVRKTSRHGKASSSARFTA